MSTVIVLAKAPRPGRVKTRLCPPLTFTEAACVARAALDDTLAAVSHVECDRRVLALDECVAWLRPSGYHIVRQSDGNLADRLAAAFAASDGPTVLVGMDTPQITASLIESALGTLTEPDDAVLGVAEDGGYWLVGMSRRHPLAFEDVPMSTHHTGAAQRRQLRRVGYDIHQVSVLRDVDHCGDALQVAAAAPGTHFAAAVAALDIAARVDAIAS